MPLQHDSATITDLVAQVSALKVEVSLQNEHLSKIVLRHDDHITAFYQRIGDVEETQRHCAARKYFSDESVLRRWKGVATVIGILISFSTALYSIFK